MALKTGSRAVDAYFIASANYEFHSYTYTNNKIMFSNAKKYGIECYYLIENFDEVMDKIKVK